MKETGKVIKVEGNQATVFIKRGTACGECGKCQVGKEKLEMIMTTDNIADARVGDEVEIELENMNFMIAAAIAYGFPLIALMTGILGGYYGFLALGFNRDVSQAVGAVFGLIALAASYGVIRYKDKKIKKMQKFKPVIVGIRSKDSI